ncbi:hypothetical protein [Azospirillum palustre]
MGAIVRFFVGLWMIWLPIATVIYVFSNNSMDEVEKANLSTILYKSKLIIIGPDIMREAMKMSTGEDYKDNAFKLQVESLKKLEVDTEHSLYKLIKSSSKNKNVRITNAGKLPGKDPAPDLISLDFQQGRYAVSLKFIAQDQSFMEPWRADLISIFGATLALSDRGASSRPVELSENQIYALLISLASNKDVMIENVIPVSSLRGLS